MAVDSVEHMELVQLGTAVPVAFHIVAVAAGTVEG